MSVVSKPIFALLRKRLASTSGAFIAASLCALLGACGNDDSTSPLGSNNSSASNKNNSSIINTPVAVLPTDPALSASGSPALTIQTPALPSSDADATLSATAPAPLATPVIHTAD